jgi:hypothetical protein
MPLSFLSDRFKGTRRGNYLMWMGLFCGQPMLEIIYFKTALTEDPSFSLMCGTI